VSINFKRCYFFFKKQKKVNGPRESGAASVGEHTPAPSVPVSGREQEQGSTPQGAQPREVQERAAAASGQVLPGADQQARLADQSARRLNCLARHESQHESTRRQHVLFVRSGRRQAERCNR
jgi:hypothetical protein